jgi:hypothetical protein
MATPATPIASVVSGAPAAAPAAAAAPPAAAVPDLAALTAERDQLKATAAEHERTARFWYGKANAAKPAPAAATAPAAEETDLLDLITSKGEKGFKSYLKSQGFVSADEVDAKVNDKATQIVSEGQLIKDYPDLADKNSDFFKSTAQFYGDLKQRGVPEREAMQLGAQLAELGGIRAGTIKTAAQKTEDAKATREEERRARAAAGAGDRGSRASAEEADEDLTPAQRNIAIRMLGGDGVSDDQAVELYKKRAAGGVRMKAK